MPSGPRIRSNSEFGLITDNPLTAVATTFNSARLSLFPVVSSAHAVVTLDPRAIFGEPEIVVITVHAAAATVATIVRGQYGTVARPHPVGTEWIHAPLDEDFVENVAATAEITDPYRGQLLFDRTLNRYVGRSTADAWDNINMFADPPACRVTHNANVSYASNVAQFVQFNTERFKTVTSMHDNVTNNGRITIPVAGIYQVTASIVFAARNDFEVAFAAIIKNGNNFQAIQNSRAAIVGTADLHVTVTSLIKFVVNDFVVVQAIQRNTAAAAVNLLTVNEYGPEFQAVWVGRG